MNPEKPKNNEEQENDDLFPLYLAMGAMILSAAMTSAGWYFYNEENKIDIPEKTRTAIQNDVVDKVKLDEATADFIEEFTKMTQAEYNQKKAADYLEESERLKKEAQKLGGKESPPVSKRGYPGFKSSGSNANIAEPDSTALQLDL